ncbi:MAG: hypothetical protein AAF358_02920 [Pseudomonadota bacterium]
MAEKHAILFADISGYSKLDYHETGAFHEYLMECLYERISTVVDGAKYTNSWGDGVIVIHERTLLLASAARTMNEYLNSNEYRHEPKGDARFIPPGLKMRVALHYGGYEKSLDPFRGREETPYGPSIVTAARLEPKVEPGQIWATDEYVSELKTEFFERQGSDISGEMSIRPLGEIELAKGFGNHIVHELYAKEGHTGQQEESPQQHEETSSRSQGGNGQVVKRASYVLGTDVKNYVESDEAHSDFRTESLGLITTMFRTAEISRLDLKVYFELIKISKGLKKLINARGSSERGLQAEVVVGAVDGLFALIGYKRSADETNYPKDLALQRKLDFMKAFPMEGAHGQKFASDLAQLQEELRKISGGSKGWVNVIPRRKVSPDSSKLEAMLKQTTVVQGRALDFILRRLSAPIRAKRRFSAHLQNDENEVMKKSRYAFLDRVPGRLYRND